MIHHPKFILKQAMNQKYYFRLTAKNGQIIAQSDMHTTKEKALRAAELTMTSALVAETDDQTEEG